MAPTLIDLSTTAWTKIGDNVSDISFQVQSSFDVYVYFTSADSEPSETIGFRYARGEKVIKTPLTDLTYVASPAYVWAKSVAGSGGGIIVETA